MRNGSKMYEGIAHVYLWSTHDRKKVAEVPVGQWADLERACSELDMLVKRVNRDSVLTGLVIETRLREIDGCYDEDHAVEEILEAVRNN